MKGSIKIGKIGGIGLYIHWTFALLILYLVVNNYSTGHDSTQLIWNLVFISCIFITVLIHELGHAFAAKKFKYKTIDITLLPIGGIARLEALPERPLEEFAVAIAGPACNLILGIMTLLFIPMPHARDLAAQLAQGVQGNNFLLHFFIVNIWLALFNLIPAFPMDGGRVLRAVLAMRMSRLRATKISARIAQAIAFGFVVLGLYNNIFLTLIGIFIFFSAQAEASFTYTKSMLEGATVKDVLMKQFQSIDVRESITTAVKFLLDGHAKNFVVMENSKFVGTLNQKEIIKALSLHQDDQSIQSILNKDIQYLQEDLTLEEAYQAIQENKYNFMPVLKNNLFTGVLDLENIMEYLLIKEAHINSFKH